MHELSLCVSLVEQIEAVATREQATCVTRVELVVGDRSGVEPEALEFAFPMAAEGTVAQGAELVIEAVEGRDFLLKSLEVS